MSTAKANIALSCKLLLIVIIYLVVGWPGSVHDARVLSNSSIFEKANSNKLFQGIPSRLIGDQNIHPLIIGDPGYPLLSWLMKPYPENANTPRIERVFNYRLSRARMTAENTFGRWKGRFIRFTREWTLKCHVCVVSLQHHVSCTIYVRYRTIHFFLTGN